MANLIDKTYFIGELDLPTTNAGVDSELLFYITKYEKQFLSGIMGPALYAAFIAGLLEDPIPARWTALKTFLVPTDIKISPIANYVYFKYINNKETQTTGVGVVKTKTENSVRVSHINKSVSAMRECKLNVLSFFDFIKESGNYPEFEKTKALDFYRNNIAGINTFNL